MSDRWQRRPSSGLWELQPHESRGRTFRSARRIVPAAPSGPNFTLNLPSGLTTVLNTGHMTATPATQGQNGGGAGTTWNVTGPTGITTTFTNDSPSSISGTGEWSGNLVLPSDGGLRLLYQTSLAGGNSPVRIGTNTFSSFGTGFIYIAFRIRFSTGWSFSTASQVKLFDVHTVTGGNNHILVANATGTDDNIHATGSAYPAFLLQGNVTGYIPGGKIGTSNGLPPFDTAPATVYANASACSLLGAGQIGTWNTVEVYMQPESVPLTSNDGQMTMWVNGNLQWSSVGQNDGTSGQTGINYDSGGWHDLFFDPTYGGDVSTDHPPALQYWDIDYMYAAVK
jgi:hypothetical protein